MELAPGNRSSLIREGRGTWNDKARGAAPLAGEGERTTWVRRFAQVAEALNGLKAAPP